MTQTGAELGAEPAVAGVREVIQAFGADRNRLLDIVQAVRHGLGQLSDAAIHAFLNRTSKGSFHIRLSKAPISMMKGAADVAQAFIKATAAPFAEADLMLLNKADLLPHLDFDVTACASVARRVNPRIEIIILSARTGEGLTGFYRWIEAHLSDRERSKSARLLDTA